MSEATEGVSRDGALTTSVDHVRSHPRARLTHRLWTQDEEERLTTMRSVEGLSCPQIAKELNRTERSVQAKIKAMGLSMPASWARRNGWGTTLPSRTMINIRRFWMHGIAIEEAAKRLGLHEPRIARAYRQLSDEERARPAVPPQIGTYIGAKEMMAIVAPICGIAPTAITGPSRLKPFVCARIAIARALRDRGLSYTQIARALGRTDHSTAIHWLLIFEPHCRAYPETLRAYQAIKRAEAIAAERRAA